MRRYMALLRHLVRHKWYVFLECCKLGIPLLGILHDLSKLRPDEFVPYARHFYNRDGTKRQFNRRPGYCKIDDIGDEVFNVAWGLHQKRNKHHPCWVGDGKEVVEMSDRYILEMVADWRGAAKAQNAPDITMWYEGVKDKMNLHPRTRRRVEELLYDVAG